MRTPILYLDILLIALSFYPSGVTQIIALAKRPGTSPHLRYMKIGTIYLAAILALAALYLPYYDSFTLRLSLKGILLGLAAAILLTPLEYGAGYILLRAKGIPVKRGLEIHKTWQNQSAAVWALTIAYAVLEELLYRGVWGALLIDQFGAAWYVFLICSAILYGINHLYMGSSAVMQKFLTGICLGAVYLLSGRELLVPVIAHVGQNLILWGVNRRNRCA